MKEAGLRSSPYALYVYSRKVSRDTHLQELTKIDRNFVELITPYDANQLMRSRATIKNLRKEWGEWAESVMGLMGVVALDPNTYQIKGILILIWRSSRRTNKILIISVKLRLGPIISLLTMEFCGIIFSLSENIRLRICPTVPLPRSRAMFLPRSLQLRRFLRTIQAFLPRLPRSRLRYRAYLMSDRI